MADTTYTDNVTVITADTMNDLNRLHYTILGDPATGAAAANTLITGLTADASPDVTADYLVTADASAATGKKVLVKNLFAGATAVGIGTGSPSYTLDVSGTIRSDAWIGRINDSAPTADCAVFRPADNSLAFSTANIERARIDANGYLLVGYTSSNGAYPLQVNGQIFATSGTIATSDLRYKNTVQTLTGALGFVSALRPVTFRWRKHPTHNFDEGAQVGFIAQEVEAAFGASQVKDSVVKRSRAIVEPGKNDKDGNPLPNGLDEEFLGLAESKLIPYLVGAIQELKAEFDAYKAAHP